MLISFEYLLTCDGDELGMLEDSIEAIHALENVHVRFVPAIKNNTLLQPRFFGTRFYCKVVIPLPAHMFNRLPQELKDGASIRIVPVVFNIGIDHRASIARVLTLVIERNY
jgi:inositol polyphosphate-4-phosphatase